MKTYTATIRLLTARPLMNGAPLPMAPLEARDEFAAARLFAMRAAKLLYGENGQPGFATWAPDGECRINIGEYLGDGVLRGVTAIVRVHEA